MPDSPRKQPQLPGLDGRLLAALYIALALAPLAAAATGGVETGTPWQELGAGLALVAGALLYLQFLSSGRFESLGGRLGIDRTMGFHRLSALLLLSFAILHPLSYVAPAFWQEPEAALNRLGAMVFSPRLRSGVLAFVLLAILVSFAAVRHRALVRYEHWRATHGLAACAAAGLALHHTLKAGTYSAEPALEAIWYVYAGLALFAIAIVYTVRPWRMWRSGWRVAQVASAADGITELVIEAPEGTALDFRGGQFVWLTIAPNHPPFHDHPFSLASCQSELPRLRLLVRHAGDCTNHFDGLTPGTRVAVDGPHGSFVLEDRDKAIVLIAGGVGIAPILGMLADAASREDKRPFRLIYAARRPASLAGRQRLEALMSRLDLDVSYVVDEDGKPPLVPGPIRESLIRKLVAGQDLAKTGAYICGPAGLMESVSDCLIACGVPEASVHYERFDYAAGRGRLDKRRRNQAASVLALIALGAGLFAIR